MELKRIIDVATGRKPAQLVLKHAKVVNVFTGEISNTNVAIDHGVIAGMGSYSGETEVDLHGRYLVPGLIDSHVHIESSLVSPEQFARIVVPFGTTTVIADPHEIANVRGIDGIRYMMNAAKNVPLDVHFMIPSCVPATGFENAGAELDAEAMKEIIEDPAILGLGEMMDYPSLLQAERGVLDKLRLAQSRGMPIDGHGPMLEGKQLNAYRAAGIQTDHECTTLVEMQNRLQLGMYVLIREGSAARNLIDLVKGVTPENAHRCCFCTDDKQPEEIFREGHINNNIRLGVREGLNPITAIRMATINAAQCYGLKGKGAIAPGYNADLAVLEDLESFKVLEVYKAGEKVAADGKALFSVSVPDISPVKDTVKVKKLSPESFALKLESDLVHVIHVHPRSITTEKTVRKVYRDEQGRFKHHAKLDILKLAVVERHKLTGNIGLGLVDNFRLRGGAIATSIGHDSHNLIIMGDNDEDMLTAANELIRVGGGMTVSKGGRILETLPLPVAGLMSNRPVEEVNEKMKTINEIAFKELDIDPEMDPFSTLSFLALPVIPELRLTDMGLFDVTEYNFIPVCADEEER